MANYSTLKTAVADVVKTNGTKAITGANLQSVLLSIINSVGGGGYIFKGVATPSTSAGTPDENVFYIGGAGSYANFGTSVTVPVGSICVFKYNGSWTKEQIALFTGIDDVPILCSDNLVKSGGIATEVADINARLYREIADIGITSTGTYYVNTGQYSSLIVSVKNAKQLSIKRSSNRNATYAFLKTIENIRNGASASADFCEGTTITTITSSDMQNIEIPNDCEYLYVLFIYNTVNYAPALLFVDGFDLLEDVSNIKTYIDRSDVNLSATIDRRLDSILNGTTINQPTQADILNKYLSSDGYWGTPNYSLLIDVSLLHGYHVTQSSTAGGQYAFLKNSNDLAVDFVEGGGRISGTLSNTLVPNDANYLYLYLGNNTPSSLPTITINDNSVGVNNEIGNLKNAVAPMSGIVDAVDKLNWPAPIYTFTESEQSSATLDNNIVLSQDGNSIEFKLLTCAYIDMGGTNQKAYAFAKGGSSSKIGIGVSRGYISVRADDGTWVVNNIAGNFIGKTIKLSYESGNICFYVDNELISTYTGQKTLTILSFGDGSTYGYWDGSITSLKVNRADYDLRIKATLNNIEVKQNTSFLSEEEKEMIYDEGTPTMMAEKTATNLTVYKKLTGNMYVGYPLNYRYASYSAGAYPSYYDNWGIGRPFIAQYENNGMTMVVYLFSTAEAEVAISVPRGDGQTGNEYVGGSVHGFENIVTGTDGREFCIMVDDMKCGETDTFALKEVSSVHVVQGTNLVQAYTNSNPFAYVTKKWDFEKNSSFQITSKATILRSITIALCQFGMFGVYRHYDGNSSKGYLTNKAVKDSQPYKVFSVVDGWEDDSANNQLKAIDYNCNKITEYGEYGLGFALLIKDDNRKSTGGMNVGTNGGSYNKIYFGLCRNYSASTNDDLHATQVWEIEGKLVEEP